MADVTRRMEIDLTAKDNTKAATESAKSNLVGLAKEAAAVSLAMGAMITAASINAWAKQEQALLQQENRLKTTGAAAWTTSKQLQDLAASLQSVTVFGDDAVTEMQNLLLTFTNIKGPVFTEANRAILDLAAAMAQGSGGEIDLKSAAIQVGKALNDPAQGMTALQRVGVSFTEEQKNVIKSLQETGRVAEAQKMILAELTKEFGGAATAQGLSGAIAQARNFMGELSEEFGRGVAEGSELTKTLGHLSAQFRDKDNLAGIYALGNALGTLVDWYIKLNQAVGVGAAKVATGFVSANADWAGVNNANTVIPSGVVRAVLEPAAATFGGALAAVAAAELAKTPGMTPQLKARGLSMPGMPGKPGIVPTLGGVSAELGEFGDTGSMAAPGMGPIWMAATGNLADLEAHLMSEEELITAAALRWQQMANDARDQGIISEQEARDLKYQIWDEEQQQQQKLLDDKVERERVSAEKITAITIAETRKKAQAEEAANRQFLTRTQNSTGFVMNSMKALSLFSGQQGEKDFKREQNAQAAMTMVNGIATAWVAAKSSSNKWEAIASIAVIMAKTLADVGAIKSQKYTGSTGGSSGGVTFPSVTPVLDSPVMQPTEAPTAAARAISYNITVLGNIVDQDAFARQLIVPLERARLDGVTA